jgi:hypothetical protein
MFTTTDFVVRQLAKIAPAVTYTNASSQYTAFIDSKRTPPHWDSGNVLAASCNHRRSRRCREHSNSHPRFGRDHDVQRSGCTQQMAERLLAKRLRKDRDMLETYSFSEYSFAKDALKTDQIGRDLRSNVRSGERTR